MTSVFWKLTQGDTMQLIFFLLLAVILVFGGVFILLRTAKKPKVPKDFKFRSYDDENSGW